MSKENEMRNVRIWVRPASDSADFHLIINVVNDKGEPIATIGQSDYKDSERLHSIFQAYRMGQRFPS